MDKYKFFKYSTRIWTFLELENFLAIKSFYIYLELISTFQRLSVEIYKIAEPQNVSYLTHSSS